MSFACKQGSAEGETLLPETESSLVQSGGEQTGVNQNSQGT